MMNRDLKHKIEDLINKATVSLKVFYGMTPFEMKLNIGERRGLTSCWGCYCDKKAKKWCTFVRCWEDSIKTFDSEREALLDIISNIEADEMYFYTKERFIEEIKACQVNIKMPVGIYLNQPCERASKDLYFITGYERKIGHCEEYFIKYYNKRSDDPITVLWNREEDALYSMLSIKNVKELFMTKDEIKKEIERLAEDNNLNGYVNFKDERKFPSNVGCFFDEELQKYVTYSTTDRNEIYSYYTSEHEEFCMAELYNMVQQHIRVLNMNR